MIVEFFATVFVVNVAIAIGSQGVSASRVDGQDGIAPIGIGIFHESDKAESLVGFAGGQVAEF